MNRSGRLSRSHISYEPADRCELAADDGLDQEAAGEGMADHGLGGCGSCLCPDDVSSGAIFSIYLPGKVFILCRHAMDRVRLC